MLSVKSRLSYFRVCAHVCAVCLCVVNVHVCVCICLWRLETDVRHQLALASHSRFRANQIQGSLIGLASLHSLHLDNTISAFGSGNYWWLPRHHAWLEFP